MNRLYLLLYITGPYNIKHVKYIMIWYNISSWSYCGNRNKTASPLRDAKWDTSHPKSRHDIRHIIYDIYTYVVFKPWSLHPDFRQYTNVCHDTSGFVITVVTYRCSTFHIDMIALSITCHSRNHQYMNSLSSTSPSWGQLRLI